MVGILKRIIIFILASVIVIIGILYLLDKTKFTSLQKEILDEISEDDTVEISIKRYSDNARISTTDKEMIEKILADVSGTELKKEVNDVSSVSEYAIRIYLKNDKNGSSNLGFEVTKDKNYIVLFKKSGHTKYKVVSDNNYLKTIEKLDLQLPDE